MASLFPSSCPDMLDTVATGSDERGRGTAQESSKDWTELQQEGGPARQVASEVADFGEDEKKIFELVVGQAKENDLVPNEELRRGQLRSSQLGDIIKVYLKNEPEDIRKKGVRKRVLAFYELGATLRVKLVDGKMWVGTESNQQIVALSGQQEEAINELIQIWKETRDALQSSFSQEQEKWLFPATWRSERQPDEVDRFYCFGMWKNHQRDGGAERETSAEQEASAEQEQETREYLIALLQFHRGVVEIRGKPFDQEAARLQSEWSETDGMFGFRLACNALQSYIESADDDMSEQDETADDDMSELATPDL